MIKLPKGITGFGNSPPVYGDEFIPKLERKLMAIPNCKVLSVIPPQVSNNYYAISLEYFLYTASNSSKISLLINSVYKIYATIDTTNSSWMDLKFIKPPDPIAKELTGLIEQMTLEQLQLNTSQCDLSELYAQEVKQIKYWESKTIGSIVFNGYD